MKPDRVRSYVQQLNTKKSLDAEDAWDELRGLGIKVVPYLAEAYPTFNLWQGRVACVYHCVKYARESEEAYALGVQALGDRATLVRYRACSLLAYSLRPDAIEPLEALLSHKDTATAEDAAAAIRAITKRDHNLFIDRDPNSRGNSGWIVSEADRERLFDELNGKPSVWERLKMAVRNRL